MNRDSKFKKISFCILQYIEIPFCNKMEYLSDNENSFMHSYAKKIKGRDAVEMVKGNDRCIQSSKFLKRFFELQKNKIIV